MNHDAVAVDAPSELARVGAAVWALIECDTYAEDVEGALAAGQGLVAATAARHALIMATRALSSAYLGVTPEEGFIADVLRVVDPLDTLGFVGLWHLPDPQDAEEYCRQVFLAIDGVRRRLPFPIPRVPDEMFKALSMGRSFLEVGDRLGVAVVDENEWFRS